GKIILDVDFWFDLMRVAGFAILPVVSGILYFTYAEITTRIMWNMIVQRYDALPIEAQNILSGDL
ncbi:MAG: hypothetical protein AAF787_10465, partial [Chloroflexota bacterium]